MSHVWRPLTQHKTQEPINVRRAHGIMLELEDGREVMNLVSNWWYTLHGHSNETIAQAIYQQAHTLEHVNFSDFTHEAGERLAERLCALTPLDKVFYSDNGSTAVEVALKIALQYCQNIDQPQRTSFIRFEEGYHGDTFGAMAVGCDSPYTIPFQHHLFPVDTVPYPTSPDQETPVLAQIDQLLASKTHAGIIIEPLIQGAGGFRFCRPQFLQQLEALARHHKTLVIYDEVMTGFGRTGDWFAHTKAGTKPDLLCLSKGLSGGYLPLAATLATDAIFDTFLSDDPRACFAHSHSMSGSAIGCAAALASLDLLADEPFRQIEQWHRPWVDKTPGARLCGTCAAFELPGENDYYNPIGKQFKRDLLEQGFYFRPLGNTVFFLPSYCITKAQLDSAWEAATTWAEKPTLTR